MTREACAPPEGYVDNDTDCDDTNSEIFPSAPEIGGDGIDQNCDGADVSGFEYGNRDIWTGSFATSMGGQCYVTPITVNRDLEITHVGTGAINFTPGSLFSAVVYADAAGEPGALLTGAFDVALAEGLSTLLVDDRVVVAANDTVWIGTCFLDANFGAAQVGIDDPVAIVSFNGTVPDPFISGQVLPSFPSTPIVWILGIDPS